MGNCPFCIGRPYAVAKVSRGKELTACANNKCAIFGVYMTVKQWEKGAVNVANGK